LPIDLYLRSGPVGHLTRLFALIIGINNYQSKEFFRLRGAVPDGKEFKDYLMKRLRVPEGQISTLFGEQATRSAIIQAFKDLSKDNRIKEGDPIFIFYAGHGAQKTPHPDWKEPNAKIEVIVPYDCTDDSDRQTPATGFVPSIPDITIAALINEIAREKGNNIVSGIGGSLNPHSHSLPEIRPLCSTAVIRPRERVVAETTLQPAFGPFCWGIWNLTATPTAIFGIAIPEARVFMPDFRAVG